jgi:hypothetical protein
VNSQTDDDEDDDDVDGDKFFDDGGAEREARGTSAALPLACNL